MAVTSLLLGSGIPGIIDAPVQDDPNNPHNAHAQQVYNHAAIQVSFSVSVILLPHPQSVTSLLGCQVASCHGGGGPIEDVRCTSACRCPILKREYLDSAACEFYDVTSSMALHLHAGLSRQSRCAAPITVTCPVQGGVPGGLPVHAGGDIPPGLADQFPEPLRHRRLHVGRLCHHRAVPGATFGSPLALLSLGCSIPGGAQVEEIEAPLQPCISPVVKSVRSCITSRS